MTKRSDKYDVAVVGGGIVGLAMAWTAARRGESTVLFERSAEACGASVRNFGMIWPIGQPAGELLQTAMRSRELWLQLAAEAGVWVNPCGSLHLVRREDELAVVEEFLGDDPRSSDLSMLTPQQVAKKSPAANIDGLRCALWSPLELCVNPPAAVRTMTAWLAQQHRVDVRTGVTVVGVDNGRLTASNGATLQAERIAVCSGNDFGTLFPRLFQQTELLECKLQMMATGPQPGGWRLGPHLAGGLTLRHYQAFADCPSLPKLRQRVAAQNPLLDRYGIHVMASQNDAGDIVLGDSHQYADSISPFDSAEIDNLILAELRPLMNLPDFTIKRRWHGVYAKHATQPFCILQPQPNCRIVTGLGGAGMTLAFGLAEKIHRT